ncbi:MAG: threonylcarbamoyl-AMP synthase [Elusimicrobia bacterium]|nr:threonylcarbamoyl-AMP synthase [Elusimicrobiota bacterium]
MTALLIRCENARIPPSVLPEIVTSLKHGDLILFPTDTVYGLGGNALDPQVFGRIYHAKDRPPSKPLPILVHSVKEAKRWVLWTPVAEALARKFWPGPLTLILPASPGGKKISAGVETLGIRVPNHPVILELLRNACLPLASTSANRSGESAPGEANHIASSLREKTAYLLDAGKTLGIESTVVNLAQNPFSVLRAGAISENEMHKIL